MWFKAWHTCYNTYKNIRFGLLNLGQHRDLRFDSKGRGWLCGDGVQPKPLQEVFGSQVLVGPGGSNLLLGVAGEGSRPLPLPVPDPKYLSLAFEPTETSSLQLWQLGWCTKGANGGGA